MINDSFCHYRISIYIGLYLLKYKLTILLRGQQRINLGGPINK